MNFGNINKIDFLMSCDRDFVGAPNRVLRRYAVCSTARCGSNMFSDFLYQSGLAGDPLEYLNVRYIAGYKRARGLHANARVNLLEYLSGIEARRTSPNGYFGIKMHFEHVSQIFGSDLVKIGAFLARFDRFILLRRRNKLAQAVSLYRAQVSQIWTSSDRSFLAVDDPRLTREVKYDFAKISRALYEIISQEVAWESVLNSNRIEYMEVVFEDFLANRREVGHQIYSFLGLDPSALSLKASSFERQGADDDPFLIRFLIDLGGFERSVI